MAAKENMSENTQELIEEVRSCGGHVSENGFITLYHNTTESSAKAILATGKMWAKEDGVFFSTKPDGYASGYGCATVKFKIPARMLLLDDVFKDEAHLRWPLSNKHQIVSVKEYLQRDDS